MYVCMCVQLAIQQLQQNKNACNNNRWTKLLATV